jgi:hypothetical protein
MARLTTKSVYGIGKQAKQSPANKGVYMENIHYIIITTYDTHYITSEQELLDTINIFDNANIKYKIFQEKL